MAAGTPTVTVEVEIKANTPTSITFVSGSTYRCQLLQNSTYVVGDAVTISGMTGAGNTGTFTVTAVNSASSFDFTGTAAGSPASQTYSGVWLDVSSLVVGNSVSINQGRTDSLSDPQPGTLALTLDNFDGRFTPDNPTSIYYPYIVENMRVRVTVTRNGSSWVRFFGRVTDLAPKSSESPGQSTVDLLATDALGLMQRRNFVDCYETEYARQLTGNYYLNRNVLSTSPPSGTPLTHYPLTEGTAATGYYDVEALQPSNYSLPFTVQNAGGSVTPQGETSFPDGPACVSLTSGSWLRTIVNTNYFAAFGVMTGTAAPVLRVWVNLQSTGEVLSFSTAKRTPGTAFNTTYDSLIVSYNIASNVLAFQDSTGTVTTTAVKGWHLIEAAHSVTGTDVIYVDGVSITPASTVNGALWYNLTTSGRTFYATLGGTISAGYRNFGLWSSAAISRTPSVGGMSRIPYSTNSKIGSIFGAGEALTQLGYLVENTPFVPRSQLVSSTGRQTTTITSTSFAAGVLTVNTSSLGFNAGDTVTISGNSVAANNGAYTIDGGGSNTFTVLTSTGVTNAVASGYVSVATAFNSVVQNPSNAGYVAPVNLSGRTAFDVLLELARAESGRVYSTYTSSSSLPTIVPLSLVKRAETGATFSITSTTATANTLVLTVTGQATKVNVGTWVTVSGTSVAANNGTFNLSSVSASAASGVSFTMTLTHPGGAAVSTGGTATIVYAPQLTLDVEADLSAAPTFVREAATTLNTATVTSSVASVTSADTTQDSRSSSASASINAASANPLMLYSFATQLVALGKFKGLRATDLTFSLDTSSNDLYSSFFALWPGCVVTLTGLPSAYLGVTSMSGVVEGWMERPSVGGYEVTLNVSPVTPRESSFSTGDSFGFGDGNAYLGAAITSSATSLVLTWTSGDVLSTTAADYPLDLNVNGERVTVTAAPAGSTSPQTLTVSRGVAPTVARAHNQYEPVELWTPATLAP